MEKRKVAIIGDGAVGSSIAYTLMLGHAVNDIAIIDLNHDKAEGDALDMADGMSFLSVPKIVHAGGYEQCRDAHIVIITAGAAQKPGETRLDLLAKNAGIYDSIIAQMAPNLGKETIVLIVSNPVDILSYYAASKLGLPSSRVFGSGTVLDTSRLKTAISKDAGVDPRNVHTLIVGEHGDSEVALWSATSIGGMPLKEYCNQCGKCARSSEHLEELHQQVKNAAYTIIQKKGATFYAVALAVSRIVSAIFNDEHSVLTVSTKIGDEFGGALKGLYFSLPCVVGLSGIEKVLAPAYQKDEVAAIISSGKALEDKLKDLPKGN